MFNAIESVTIGESFALAGVSMSIIMGVLACIMVLIYLMSGFFKLLEKHNPALKAKIDALFSKKTEPTEASEPVATEEKDVVTARGSCGNIVLKNVHLKLDGGVKAYKKEVPEQPICDYPEVFVYGRILPAKGIYFRHINGLIIDNVTVETYRPDKREDFVYEDVKSFAKIR